MLKLCNVSYKSRLNGIVVCEDYVLECSCSDYYLNCADVCELLFLKIVILARLLDCRQQLTVIKIHVQPHDMHASLASCTTKLRQIVSTCMQLT